MTVRFYTKASSPNKPGEYRDKFGVECLRETVDRWYFGKNDESGDDMYYLKSDIVGLPVIVEAR